MPNPTAETIIGLYRSLIRSESGSDVPVIQDDFALKAVSDANLEYARAFRKGGGTQPISFSREGGFNLVSDTALNEASGITSSDTDFTVDSSDDFDATNGAGVIWTDSMADVFLYTTNTVATETFSGVTNLAFSHDDNDVVQKLYKLTSLTSFGKLRKAEGYGDGIKVNGVPYYFQEGPPESGRFSIYDDGTNKFLWLPRGLSGRVSVLFDKASATIDSLDDTVDVPEEFQFFLAWRLVEFGCFGRDQDAGLAAYAKAKGDEILLDALKAKEIGQRIRVRPITRRGRPLITASELGIG